jgi:hypothetical protein
MQARNYRIPLPIPTHGPFARLDKETFDFGRQAFEMGMDWIRQEEKMLEIGSRSFRPVRHGRAGFIDQLGRGLGKIDWKLSFAEGEHTLASLENSRDVGPRVFAVLASLGALFLSWIEPVLNHGAVVLDPRLAYMAALALAVFVFIYRFRALRQKFSQLRRKPPFLAECFWPAFGAGVLALIPFQHLNVKLDSSVPRLVTAQVTKKISIQGISQLSYVVQAKSIGGKGVWLVELSHEDYLAATPGGTMLTLRFHPGAFGMGWLERATLEEVDRMDRNVAGSPNDRGAPPPLGK